MCVPPALIRNRAFEFLFRAEQCSGTPLHLPNGHKPAFWFKLFKTFYFSMDTWLAFWQSPEKNSLLFYGHWKAKMPNYFPLSTFLLTFTAQFVNPSTNLMENFFVFGRKAPGFSPFLLPKREQEHFLPKKSW